MQRGEQEEGANVGAAVRCSFRLFVSSSLRLFVSLLSFRYVFERVYFSTTTKVYILLPFCCRPFLLHCVWPSRQTTGSIKCQTLPPPLASNLHTFSDFLSLDKERIKIMYICMDSMAHKCNAAYPSGGIL